MKRLPERWTALRTAAPQARALMLFDGALQRPLADRARAHGASDAVALLPTDDAEGRQLGPWLLSEAAASACGAAGIAPGINWVLARQSLDEVADHLSRHAITRGQGNDSPIYLRMADGRTLGHLLPLWGAEQRARFFAPFLAWCAADRDGRPVMHEPDDVPAGRSGPASHRPPIVSETQLCALVEASVPDMLLAHLGACADDGGNEARYRLAVRTIVVAGRLGYEGAGEQAAILAAVLAHGAGQTLEDELANVLSARPREALLRSALQAWSRPATAENPHRNDPP